MSATPLQRAFGRVWADIEATSDAMDRGFADGGWIVVVVDGQDANPRTAVSFGEGPFDQPEQALARAAEMDAEHKSEGPESAGWVHAVVPLRKTKGEG